MPSYQAKTPAQYQEDRRRFYVSITRARHDLRVFYSGFVTTKWGNRRNTGVSPFVREIGLGVWPA